jgi:predicted dehydrogenase/nucleoside-diphosphate-sugar epimerase
MKGDLMEKFKIGIIGCGAATKRYYVPAFKKYPEISKNVYLVDKNLSKAQEIGQELGSDKIFKDYKDVIGKVEGVIIVLPHFLHFKVAMDFLNAGTHVLCEKPLAELKAQVEEMISAAEQKNVQICVNNTRRMFPSFQKLKELVDNGTIQDISEINFIEGSIFEWPSETSFYVDPKVSAKGVLLDIGSHVLDLICWWLGHKPELVQYRDDSYGGPESLVHIQAKSKKTTINITLNRLLELNNGFRLEGNFGSIEGKQYDWNKLVLTDKSGKSSIIKNGAKVKTYPEFVIPIVDNFFDVISGKGKPLISAVDVKDSIHWIDECYSQRQKNTFYPNKFVPHIISKSENVTLVTGATGFIGGRIVEALYMSQDRKVRASARQWSTAARLGRFPVDIVSLDLLDRKTIEEALDGVTEVIHCAKGSQEVTVNGTRNLIDLAFQRGVHRFVHLSTADVYGDAEGSVQEEMPFHYTGTEYNQSKIDAEKICWEYADKGLPLVILRPSIVYGPFSKNWSIRYASMFLAGKGAIYEKIGEGKCNLIYIDDLVNAILLSLNNEKVIGNAFNICGPEVVSWNEYFKRFNEMMGLAELPVISHTSASIKTFTLQPVRIFGNIVRNYFMGPVKKVAETFEIAKNMMKQTESTLKMTPSTEELKLINRDVIFSCEKAKNLLGFTPSVSLSEGLESTVEWLKQQGFLIGKNGNLTR